MIYCGKLKIVTIKMGTMGTTATMGTMGALAGSAVEGNHETQRGSW